MLTSYARPSSSCDNAQAEAGGSMLKTEFLFASLEVARLEVACYPDTCFNLERPYSALGYRSPHQFKAELPNQLP